MAETKRIGTIDIKFYLLTFITSNVIIQTINILEGDIKWFALLTL